MHSKHFVGASLCLLLAVPAQSPTAATADRAEAPTVASVLPHDLPRVTSVPVHHTQVGDRTEIWAAGAGFKASFHDGLTFLPHVGPTLPHHPFGWRTVRVELGGAARLLPAPSAPATDPARVEYDLGVVRERYDLRPNGLEQSFVVERALGVGDLTIVGVVAGPLTTVERAPEHAPLTFRSADGRVVVDYGEAIAFDARGRRTHVLTGHRGGEVTLTVPGSWLASATYPICIDPLISAGSIGAPGAPVGNADVVHETLSPAGSNRTWVVYSVEAAAGDRDIFVERHSSGFTGSPSLVHARIGWSLNSDNGAIALAEGSGRVVACYEEEISIGSIAIRFLAFHVHETSDPNFDGLADLITPPPTWHYWRPDVGGRLGTNGNEVMIVFQIEENTASFANTPNSRIGAVTVNPVLFPGQATGNIFAARFVPGVDQERPSINQAATEPEWVVAMVENDNTPNDDWDIEFATVDGTGNATFVDVSVEEADSELVHQRAPKIAGAAGSYCLLYATSPIATSAPGATATGSTLRSQRFDFPSLAPNGVGLPFRPHPAVTLQSFNSDRVAPGGIAFDHVSASHWCATVRDTNLETYRSVKLGYRGAVVETDLVHTAGTGLLLTVGGVAFNQAQREFVLVYGQNGSSTGQLRGARVTYDAIQPPSLHGSPCGTGTFAGIAALADKQQIGASGLRLELANVAANTGVALLGLSLGQAVTPLSLFGFGNCDVLIDLTPGVYITALEAPVDASTGTASISLDLPEELAPTVVHCQWFYLDLNDPTLSTVNATERLRLPIAR